MSNLTEKGNNLVKVLQGILEAKGDNSTVSVEEIADESGLSVASVRGTMSKLVKDGYIVSEPVEVDGKKRKRISLTDLGWEVDPDAYVAPEA
jgi:DNA-binding MarR family transcriptional regulator